MGAGDLGWLMGWRMGPQGRAAKRSAEQPQSQSGQSQSSLIEG